MYRNSRKDVRPPAGWNRLPRTRLLDLFEVADRRFLEDDLRLRLGRHGSATRGSASVVDASGGTDAAPCHSFVYVAGQPRGERCHVEQSKRFDVEPLR